MRRRLKVLSKGLLDVEDLAFESFEDYLIGFEVTFLHRTVKDYLKTPDAQSMLQSWSDDTFNADWEICKALGTLAKMTPPAILTPFNKISRLMFLYFILHAQTLDQNPLFRADIASLLEHLQTFLTPALLKNKEIWFNKVKPPRMRLYLKGDSLDLDIVIMVLCVHCGIFNYVSEKFAKEPELGHKVTNQVSALVSSMRRINGLWELAPLSPGQEHSGMPMLEFLLAQGVDPNAEFNGVTEWRIILEDLMRERSLADDRRSKSFEGLKLLLRHGADFQQQCTVEEEYGDIRTATASELLREWYDADQFGILVDIVKRRETKKKIKHGISRKIGHLKLWVTSKK
jgi:hypothetical protein